MEYRLAGSDLADARRVGGYARVRFARTGLVRLGHLRCGDVYSGSRFLYEFVIILSNTYAFQWA